MSKDPERIAAREYLEMIIQIICPFNSQAAKVLQVLNREYVRGESRTRELFKWKLLEFLNALHRASMTLDHVKYLMDWLRLIFGIEGKTKRISKFKEPRRKVQRAQAVVNEMELVSQNIRIISIRLR